MNLCLAKFILNQIWLICNTILSKIFNAHVCNNAYGQSKFATYTFKFITSNDAQNTLTLITRS